MADKKDNTLAYVLVGIGLLGIGYAVVGNPFAGTGAAGGNNTQVPPGASINTQWGTWQNNTGAPVWLTATGLLSNAAGQLMGSIAQIINATNNGTSSNAAASSAGAGLLASMGNAAFYSGRYYNPQPTGLM